MRMDKIYKKNSSDEYYTPQNAIEPILKYITKEKVVWCPFDLEHSNFVKMIKKHGCKVIHSHISEDKDFFNYEPDNYDYIISNPPFSIKGEVFERLFSLNKKFAMLVGVVGLFESKKRFNLFKNNEW